VRPRGLAAYGTPDAADLTTYAFGLARNQPFIDGNKRSAFVCAELFLVLNGRTQLVGDARCVRRMLLLAAADLGKSGLPVRLRAGSVELNKS